VEYKKIGSGFTDAKQMNLLLDAGEQAPARLGGLNDQLPTF